MIGLGGNASLGIGLSITLNDRFSQRAQAITNSMLGMGQSARQVKANMRGALSSLQMTGAAMVGVGYGAYRGISKAVESYKDFEYMMRSVQATAGQKNLPAEQLRMISDEAKKLGIEYGVLPVEVAKSMYVMAKAGVDTEPKIKKMTKAVLQLSAAADEPANIMAENLIGTLNTFQMEAGKASVVADMLSKSANLVSINVNDVMESIKYSGNTAKALHVPFEQLLGIITLLGSRHIKGSSAGIYTQQMLTGLSKAIGRNPTKAQGNAMALMGVSPQDIMTASNGLTDLYGLAKLLGERTKSMGTIDKANSLVQLVGIRGARALLPMLEEYQRLKGYIGQVIGASGSSEAIAKARLDSLAGAQKKYNAALEAFKIGAGAAFADFLMAVTPMVTKLLNVLTAIVSTKAGKFFLLLAGGALLLVGAIGAILLPLATMGLLMTNAKGGFSGMMSAGVWAFNAIGSSISQATQRLRVFRALQNTTPSGLSQYPAGTMIGGRNVGGRYVNPNNVGMWGAAMGGAGRAGRGSGMMGGLFRGTAAGLGKLMTGSMILFSAFEVLSNFMTGKFKAGLAGILGGITGFLIGGPIGAAIGMGMGSLIGGLFDDDSKPQTTRSFKDRQFYLHGDPNNNVSVVPQSRSYGYGGAGGQANDYYRNYINQGQGGTTVNLYTDGKKTLEKYINGQNEDIYVGGDIQ